MSGADKPPPHILAQWTGSGVETSTVADLLKFFLKLIRYFQNYQLDWITTNYHDNGTMEHGK